MRLLTILRVLRHHRRRVVRLLLALLGLLVVGSELPGVVDPEHAHTWAETHVPGFWAIFGLAGCILLIVVSKGLGRLGIVTREDYYDD